MAVCVDSADLEALDLGVRRLRVPILDDAVQVGIGGRYRSGVLEIAKLRDTVTIRRLDGGLLQAHIVRDWRDPSRPGSRTEVWLRAVATLELSRITAGRWAADASTVRDCADLVTFVDTAARFALAKQRRTDQRTA